MSDVTQSELGQGAGAGSGQKKGPGRLVIIGAAVGALLIAGGAGAWFLMGSGSGAGSTGSETVSADAQQPHFLDLPLMTVNLNTGGGAPEFLRVSIALEVRDPAMIAIIEPRLPRVLDTFQVYLRELRRADLEGSAGVYRLKEELHRRINLAVYPAAVDNVLFKEILIQ